MTDALLENIYYNPKNPASFSGKEKLLKEVERKGLNINEKEIDDWLQGELVHTLHKPARKKFKRNPIVAETFNENWQADLVDMKEFSKDNDGYHFILTIIDVFSKKAWALPLKNKSSKEVSAKLDQLLIRYHPIKLQTDKGTEFLNEDFRKLMKKHNIFHFTSKNSDIKCAIIERFNRTLKNKMFKYFTKTGRRRFIDVISDLLESYNGTFHRTIKMSPNDVNSSNEKSVFKNIYGVSSKREMLKKLKKFKLKPGDVVRKKYDLKPLERGYYPNWSDQIFTIYKSLDGYNKPIYKIEDSSKEKIDRRYYPQEIQKVRDTGKFRIEAVLKEKKVKNKKYYLVKWLNHPDSFNSWIPSENLMKI